MKKSPSRLTKLLAGIFILLAACGLSFVGGVYYQKSKHATVATTNGQPNLGFGGQGGFFSMRVGRRGAIGQVTAVSATSISVKNIRTGTVSTLAVTSNTQITSGGQTAAITDVKVGDDVIVRPSTSDASQAAQIIINPTQPTTGGAATPTDSQLQSN